MSATIPGGLFDLIMWPWQAARLGADMAQTMIGAQRVIGARLPMMARVGFDPMGADHREMRRMVTEKKEAFAASGRSITSAARAVREAATANAAAFGRVAGGDIFWFSNWFQLVQTNLEAATALAGLPAAALAPVHRTVKANDRRLGGPMRVPSAGKRSHNR